MILSRGQFQDVADADEVAFEAVELFDLLAAAAVAEFGLALRGSKFAPKAAVKHAAKEGQKYLGKDPEGERIEFLLMLRRAAELRKN